MNDNSFVISDPHFGHRAIINAARKLPSIPDEFRSMDQVEFMNLYMIGAWNSVVSHEDEVIVLGDIAFNMSPEEVAHVISCLNGKKILIRGNHDRGKSHHYWVRAGFTASIDGPIVLRTMDGDRVILSHEPVMRPAALNICGHKHMSNIGLGPKHICVCMERMAYKPARISEILNSTKMLLR